jgi:exodeoxyribonuclease VIII
MKTMIMLDIETLGTRPNSVITSIGAVKFGNNEILDEFYTRVDAESCARLGLKMEVSTVMWWLQQEDAPRLEITRSGKDICDALEEFKEWVTDADAEMWGNGAAFDNVLLASAYDAYGASLPWKFTNDRCYRTVKNLFPNIRMNRNGEHHNALDDARDQAIHLMSILAFMNEKI